MLDFGLLRLRFSKQIVVLAVIVIMAAGCGGGGSDYSSNSDGGTVGDPSSTNVVPTANRSVVLIWMPPTENSDDSPLTDLAGYKIYWGKSPPNLSNSVTLNNAGLTSYVVDQLTPETWFFAATAFNADGSESKFSNIFGKAVN